MWENFTWMVLKSWCQSWIYWTSFSVPWWKGKIQIIAFFAYFVQKCFVITLDKKIVTLLIIKLDFFNRLPQVKKSSLTWWWMRCASWSTYSLGRWQEQNSWSFYWPLLSVFYSSLRFCLCFGVIIPRRRINYHRTWQHIVIIPRGMINYTEHGNI